MIDKIILPEPWHWIEDDLSTQLHKEIGSSHILHGVSVKAIARRYDNDDVLFQLPNHEYQYAVVHLTWSDRSHSGGKWPSTCLFRDWGDVYQNRIIIDAQEFNME